VADPDEPDRVVVRSILYAGGNFRAAESGATVLYRPRQTSVIRRADSRRASREAIASDGTQVRKHAITGTRRRRSSRNGGGRGALGGLDRAADGRDEAGHPLSVRR